MKRSLWLIAAMAVALSAEARMYQWVNPQSGHTQLSGRPPAWYRSGEQGPRVFVLENGKVIDDTSVPVGEEQRVLLREDAFRVYGEEAAARRSAVTEAATEQPGEQAAAEEGGITVPAQRAVNQDFGAGTASAEAVPPAAPASESPDEAIARLKSIIELYDRQKTEEAKRALEQGGGTPPQGSSSGY